jgi:outer membrane protein assembly factor BamB
MPNSTRRASYALILIAALLAMPAIAVEPDEVAPANWPQFRGPNGMPVSSNPDLPTTWSTTENVEWVVDVPGVGWSSPIVWNGVVYVTAADSEAGMKEPSLGVDFSNEYVAQMTEEGLSNEEIERRINERDTEFPDEVSLSYRLFAFDLESGAPMWDRELHSGPPPVGRHRKNSYMSETPVTDGEAIYVYIAHMGLYAYGLDGTELWRMNGQRMCRTPFAWDGHLYLSSGAKGRSDTPLAGIKPGASGDITMDEMQESSDDVLWFDRTGGGVPADTRSLRQRRVRAHRQGHLLPPRRQDRRPHLPDADPYDRPELHILALGL